MHQNHSYRRVASLDLLACAGTAKSPRRAATRITGEPWILISLAVAFLSISGCHASNHYFAEKTYFGQYLPPSMRLAERPKVLTVDMTRLAGGSGASDTINAGDVLEVKIAAGLSEKDQVTMGARVSDDGTISLPEIGTVNVAGIEPSGAEALIRTAAISKQLFTNPSVTVRATDRRLNTVRVLGAVKEPGIYKLPPNASDVVSAIAAAQGLADDAGQKVEVRNPAIPVRGERRAIAGDPSQPWSNVSNTTDSPVATTGSMNAYTIDLISAAKSGDGQYNISDGGVIMVEKRDPAMIYVQGLVKAPNRYEFPVGEDLRLLDAISLAGGISNQLANKIYIVRRSAQGKDPTVIEVSYRSATHSADSNVLLGPGDVVKVAHTPATVVMEALNIIRFGINGSTTLF